MKILSLFLLLFLSVSCSKNEHNSNLKKAGVTPQGNMPIDGNYNTCNYENVIYGSFAHLVNNHNIKLMWNRYSINPQHGAYTQVVIMDRYNNIFKSPLISNNYFDIHHNSVDEHGNKLKDKMSLQTGEWYWIDLYSFDSKGNKSYGHDYQHIKRGKDIQLNIGDKVIEAGFCSFKPYGF